MKKIIMLLMVCVLILGGCGKKKNTVHSLDDLKNKSIGVQMKTTGDIYVSDIEGAQIKRFNKGVEQLKNRGYNVEFTDSVFKADKRGVSNTAKIRAGEFIRTICGGRIRHCCQ